MAKGRSVPITVTTHFEEVMSSWERELPGEELSGMLLTIGLTRLGRLMDAEYDLWCRRHFDISGAELRVILALRRAGRPYARRPTDLFRALSITSGAITKQVDRLVEKELVVRSPDALHAGGFLVNLTQKGLKISNQAVRWLSEQSILNEPLAELSEAERESGIAFCYHLLRRVEAGRKGAVSARAGRKAARAAPHS
ncbi:MarR family winged helix-turn-helix transcriptional regulator [Rhizorhabdus dicambivorans]|nr:MarR family transcriptional regulator [Rhizorhabdus dicambivorans]